MVDKLAFGNIFHQFLHLAILPVWTGGAIRKSLWMYWVRSSSIRSGYSTMGNKLLTIKLLPGVNTSSWRRVCFTRPGIRYIITNTGDPIKQPFVKQKILIGILPLRWYFGRYLQYQPDRSSYMYKVSCSTFSVSRTSNLFVLPGKHIQFINCQLVTVMFHTIIRRTFIRISFFVVSQLIPLFEERLVILCRPTSSDEERNTVW